MTGLLEQIIATGNRDANYNRLCDNWITCADGFKLSVIAGGGAYCRPRQAFPGQQPNLAWGEVDSTYPGPYTHIEVGYPSDSVPGSWHEYADDPQGTCLSLLSRIEDCTCGAVFGCIPVDLVREVVALHGGER